MRQWGSNCNNDLLVGPAALNLNNELSNSNWNIGPSLSYKLNIKYLTFREDIVNISNIHGNLLMHILVLHPRLLKYSFNTDSYLYEWKLVGRWWVSTLNSFIRKSIRLIRKKSFLS